MLTVVFSYFSTLMVITVPMVAVVVVLIIVIIVQLIIITIDLICFVIGCQVARWFLAVTNYPHQLSVTSTTSQSQSMHNGILLREMEMV